MSQIDTELPVDCAGLVSPARMSAKVWIRACATPSIVGSLLTWHDSSTVSTSSQSARRLISFGVNPVRRRKARVKWG